MTLQMVSYAVAALLAIAAILDTKTAKIPNWLIGLFIVVFIAQVVLLPGTVNLMWQLILAAGVFVVGFGLFMTGGFGAGAIKLMGVTALFMPLDRLGALGGILLAAVFAITFLSMGLRAMFGNENSAWAILARRIVPMAIPVAITGWFGLFWLT